MITGISLSVHCTKCNHWLEDIEGDVADFLSNLPMDIRSLVLSDDALECCPACGEELSIDETIAPSAEGQIEVIDIDSQELTRGDFVKGIVDLSSGESWKEVKERIYVDLANYLPRTLKTERGDLYEVLNVRHLDLDRSSLPADSPGFPSHAFGSYHAETNRGDVLLECRPARRPDGTLDHDGQEWYLVGLETPEAEKAPGQPVPKRPSGPPGANLHAYLLLYQIEVKLRWFVHEVMRSKYGEEWWADEKFWRGMADKEEVNKLRWSFEAAQKRLAEEQRQPYVKLPETNIFAYMDFRNLGEIVKAFSGDFGGPVPRKEIFLGMLGTLEIIRNAVAHNRPVSPEAVANVREASHTLDRIMKDSGMT